MAGGASDDDQSFAKVPLQSTPNILYDISEDQNQKCIRKQIWWWIGITIFVCACTILPGCILTIRMDGVEFAEALLISFGVRAIAELTQLLIERLFAFINEGGLTYYVRGAHFFITENPLEQYLTERKLRHHSREAGLVVRKGHLASFPLVWLALILCSSIVSVAPELLGAALISQTVSSRKEISTEVAGSDPRDPLFMAPDLCGGKGKEHLTLRGNCVYMRSGIEHPDDRFGFIVWQYCVDILHSSNETDIPSRTLHGNMQMSTGPARSVYARFHLEAVTEKVFTEKWVPFNNHSDAQVHFQRVLQEKNECNTEDCVNYYRGDSMILTYRLLEKVGVIERKLKGDADSVRLLQTATGIVQQRLTRSARSSFIVLVVAVKIFVLMQAISQEEESKSVQLRRAIGELLKQAGTSFTTAIALPKLKYGISKFWSRGSNAKCYVVWDESVHLSLNEALEAAPVGFSPDRNENGNTVVARKGQHKFIQGAILRAHHGYGGEAADVSGLSANVCT